MTRSVGQSGRWVGQSVNQTFSEQSAVESVKHLVSVCEGGCGSAWPSQPVSQPIRPSVSLRDHTLSDSQSVESVSHSVGQCV